MSGRRKQQPFSLMAALVLTVFMAGCLLHNRQVHSPTSAGLNTNDLIDPASQIDSQDAMRQLNMRSTIQGTVTARTAAKRSVLCLSGGGAMAHTLWAFCMVGVVAVIDPVLTW
ncbi:MAG: hypothetical protein QM703_11105 [Gemmatales bacterium]